MRRRTSGHVDHELAKGILPLTRPNLSGQREPRCRRGPRDGWIDWSAAVRCGVKSRLSSPGQQRSTRADVKTLRRCPGGLFRRRLLARSCPVVVLIWQAQVLTYVLTWAFLLRRWVEVAGIEPAPPVGLLGGRGWKATGGVDGCAIDGQAQPEMAVGDHGHRLRTREPAAGNLGVCRSALGAAQRYDVDGRWARWEPCLFPRHYPLVVGRAAAERLTLGPNHRRTNVQRPPTPMDLLTAAR